MSRDEAYRKGEVMDHKTALKRRAAALGIDLKKLDSVIDAYGIETVIGALDDLERHRRSGKEAGWKTANKSRAVLAESAEKSLADLKRRALAAGISAERFDKAMKTLSFGNMLGVVESLEKGKGVQARVNDLRKSFTLTPPVQRDPFAGLPVGGKSLEERRKEQEQQLRDIEFVFGKARGAEKDAGKEASNIDPFTGLPLDRE